MIERLDATLDIIQSRGLDTLLITHPANITYLSGFSGTDAYLVITAQKNLFITDFRYLEQAEKEIPPYFKLVRLRGSILTKLPKLINQLKVSRVGFEAKHLHVAELHRLKEGLTKHVRLISTFDLIEQLRIRKEPREIRKIREALRLHKEALAHLARLIRPGSTEQDIAAEFYRSIVRRGAEKAAFEPIVASGPHSAMPHAWPTSRRFATNDVILLDTGIELEGYKTDLTRMFFLGRITRDLKRIYKIVLEAREKAIAKIRPGIPARVIDQVARNHISNLGLGPQFGHGLGHGVGLQVHEAPPISPQSNVILTPGMIFTIEPAIYLAGKCGVRLEDMILVTEKGNEVLSDDID